MRVARPKDLAGGENPTLCRAAEGGATGKQRGGQRGESTSGLEAGERVVISGPAGPSSAALLKVVGARGESAGAALDRDAAFMMRTSSERRAQYPRERLGEKWGMVPNGITVGAGPRVEPASGRHTAAFASGCQRRPGL
jgi:hypothetical protein